MLTLFPFCGSYFDTFLIFEYILSPYKTDKMKKVLCWITPFISTHSFHDTIHHIFLKSSSSSRSAFELNFRTCKPKLKFFWKRKFINELGYFVTDARNITNDDQHVTKSHTYSDSKGDLNIIISRHVILQFRIYIVC